MFTWSKSWFHPMESFWSIANKIAYANSTSVQQVLEYLGGVFSRHRERLLFPGLQTAIKIAGMLGLDSRVVASSMFAAITDSQAFGLRSQWRMGIRYCPVCLESFTHLTEFQDSRIKTCSLHGARLLDTCPYCGRRIDPLCTAAWNCNFCGYSLAFPSRSWILQFAVGPTVDYVEAPALPSPTGEHYICGYVPDRVNLCDAIFETHASCIHSLSAGHLGCLAHELYPDSMAAGPIEFRCPIAAAAIVSAKSLGISAQGVKGGWPTNRPIISGAAALSHLESLLSRVSIDKQDDFVRRAVRGWYLEAMETFVEAAQSGHCEALWTPSATANLDFSAWTSQGFRTGDAVSKLEDLLSTAANLCFVNSNSTPALTVN